jgi:hypothetical protein
MRSWRVGVKVYRREFREGEMCTLDSDLIVREIWERLNHRMIMFLLFILHWFNLVCCDLKSALDSLA